MFISGHQWSINGHQWPSGEPHALVELLRVPAVDEGESEDSPLAFLAEQVDTFKEAFPKVGEKGTVHSLELGRGGRIDGDVELSARAQCLHLLGELSIGHLWGREGAVVSTCMQIDSAR